MYVRLTQAYALYIILIMEKKLAVNSKIKNNNNITGTLRLGFSSMLCVMW